MPVCRRVEIALYWAESPLPCSPREREREREESGKAAPSKRGCCLILRQTRKAGRVGIWGNAAVFDHRVNSETGIGSGFPSTTSWKWESELAGPG